MEGATVQKMLCVSGQMAGDTDGMKLCGVDRMNVRWVTVNGELPSDDDDEGLSGRMGGDTDGMELCGVDRMDVRWVTVNGDLPSDDDDKMKEERGRVRGFVEMMVSADTTAKKWTVD